MNSTPMHPVARLRLLLLFVVSFGSLLLALPSAVAQVVAYGTISGEVRREGTGAFLEGAEVDIVGTNLHTLTSRAGKFQLTSVPLGPQVLRISYSGLDEVRVKVDANDRTPIVVRMDSKVYDLEAMTITTVKEGNAASLVRQRTAANIQNVVSMDAFGNVADGNIGNMIQRLPGVAANKEAGDIVGVGVRGLAPETVSVSMDGMRVASAVAGFSPQGRRAALIDKIPSDFIKEIVLTKASTPDMWGDALGGTVDLITKSAFDFSERVVTYRAGATLNTYRRTNRWGPTGALTYLDTWGAQRKIGISFTGSYTETMNNRDRVQTNRPSATDARSTSARTLDDTNERFRWGLGGKVEYCASDTLRLQLDVNYSRFDYDLTRFDYQASSFNNNIADYSVVSRAAIEAGATPRTSSKAVASIAPSFTSTYTEILNANYYAQGFIAHQTFEQHRITGSVTKEWDRAKLKVAVVHNPAYMTSIPESFTARLNNIGVGVDMTNRDRPVYRQLFGVSTAFGTDFSKYLGEYAVNPDRTDDQVDTVVADLTYELLRGDRSVTLKAGGALRRQDHTTATWRQTWNYVGADGVRGLNPVTGINDDRIAQFVESRPGYGLFNGLYESRDRINYFAVRDYFKANPMHFVKVRDTRPIPDEIQEDVAAGYIMATVKAGKFTLVGGVRQEKTDLDTLAPFTDPTKPDQKTIRVRGTYDKLFPSIHLRFEPIRRLVLRASWSTGSTRPEYSSIVPTTTVTNLTGGLGTVRQGNSELRPNFSDNYDLGVEYYFEPASIISVGAFRKDIKDYIASFTTIIGTGPDNGFNGNYAGYDLVTSTNLGSAKIEGFEFNYQQQLRMLPAPFDSLSVLGNYTRLTTEGSYDFGVAQLALFVPETANFGLGYTWRGFQVRGVYTYKSAFVNTVNSNTPALSVYVSSDPTFDLNIQYQWKPTVNFFLDYVNVFNKSPSWYTIHGDRRQMSEIYGARLSVGISGRF
ncbi:MAG: TonB-dependent receptor [Opitutaceae bacterium]|nr:TonB-dependent receptor [Opitutaceae bacterium]